MLHIRHRVWVHTRGCIGAVGCVSIQTMQRIQNLYIIRLYCGKKINSNSSVGVPAIQQAGLQFWKKGIAKSQFLFR